MATTKELESALLELTSRVLRLEELTGAGTPEQAEVDQRARDEDTLSRFPTNYAEAVEFEAAKARLEGREVIAEDEETPSGPEEV